MLMIGLLDHFGKRGVRFQKFDLKVVQKENKIRFVEEVFSRLLRFFVAFSSELSQMTKSRFFTSISRLIKERICYHIEIL